jgi:L-amino acid N-acyltransferase YncA
MNNSATDLQKSIIYRAAVEDDFPTIMAFYEKFDRHMRSLEYSLPGVENIAQTWLDSFRRTLGRFSQLFVVEAEGKVAGFIRCRIKRVPPYMGDVMVGELMEIWIEPTARRSRAGETLTRMCIEWMRDQGVHSVEVQILLENEPSINMCKGLGMKPELMQLRLVWDDYKSDGTA